jgi:hypothetical protein
VKTKIEPRLEKFIEYVEAEVSFQFSAFDPSPGLSHVSAAMLLAWVGLAELVEDTDGFAWVATGPLISPRALLKTAAGHARY